MGVICQDEGKDKEKNSFSHKNTKDTSSNSEKIIFPKKRDEISLRDSKNIKSCKNKVIIDINLLTSGGANNPYYDYHKIKLLGQGSFGVVYLVKNKKLNTNYAMKIIEKSAGDEEKEEEIMNEINILRKLDHPNILKINDFYSTKKEYFLITEFCPEGELFYEIKNFAPFDEALAGWYMKQILSAVNYCHKSKIIHRDLKPENILIIKRNKKGFNTIKIIDFGTAILFNKKDKNLAGSIYYLAPEIISKNRKYTEKCDIWSCGIIMYILLTGRPPFNGDSDEQILKRIIQNHLDLEKYPWPVISSKAKDLIKKLLESDTKKRITAEEALNHEWFKCKQVITQETSGLFKVKNPDMLLNNLINYRTDNPLRSAVLAYLIHNNMQLEHVHEAIKLFNNIDLNGDGQISKDELYLGLKDFLELSGDKLKNSVNIIFNNLDTDHNGFIEYEEFIRAAVNKKIFLSTNYLRFAFDYFDRDKNGNITFEEIKNIFFINEKNKKDSKAQEQLLKCFKDSDINGNGSLTFDEFISMTKNIIKE